MAADQLVEYRHRTAVERYVLELYLGGRFQIGYQSGLELRAADADWVALIGTVP